MTGESTSREEKPKGTHSNGGQITRSQNHHTVGITCGSVRATQLSTLGNAMPFEC